MGTLGLCPRGVRCVVQLARWARGGPHNLIVDEPESQAEGHAGADEKFAWKPVNRERAISFGHARLRQPRN
jgi:hypothetical protein